MLIQKVIGGLGNQMFQYAFIKALSLRNNADYKLDLSPYEYYKLWPYELEIFNIQKKYANKNEIPFYERKIKTNNRYYSYINNAYIRPFFSKLNKHHFKEDEQFFEKDFLNKKDGYFEGYFQNEKYFNDYNSHIRKDFTFSSSLSEKNLSFLKSLELGNTISVHVRRGDYLKLGNIYKICGIDYYNKAIKFISDRVKNPIFVFFSDDLERVKENFKCENYLFIDWNKGKDSRQDMALMSMCRHNVIANSSFSWWGARLNNNKNKIVIAPKYRGTIVNKNIVPENWITF